MCSQLFFDHHTHLARHPQHELPPRQRIEMGRDRARSDAQVTQVVVIAHAAARDRRAHEAELAGPRRLRDPLGRARDRPAELRERRRARARERERELIEPDGRPARPSDRPGPRRPPASAGARPSAPASVETPRTPTARARRRPDRRGRRSRPRPARAPAARRARPRSTSRGSRAGSAGPARATPRSPARASRDRPSRPHPRLGRARPPRARRASPPPPRSALALPPTRARERVCSVRRALREPINATETVFHTVSYGNSWPVSARRRRRAGRSL